jgi:hypothetical protein
MAARLPVRLPLAPAGRPPLAAYPLVRVVLAVSDAEPFRLDDAAPVGKPFPFTFRGVPYALPPVGVWPVGVMDGLVAGHMRDSLAELLGPDAAERLTADGLTIGHLTALFEEAGRQ